MKGWQCPNCGSAHAPHIETCPDDITIELMYSPSGQEEADQQWLDDLMAKRRKARETAIDWDERAKYWLT